MEVMKEKNVKNFVDVYTHRYTILKKLSLKIVVAMFVILSTIILCANKVQAFELTIPEKARYLRWDTNALGVVNKDILFAAINSLEGLEKEIYRADNSVLEEDEYIGTGMYFKVNNEKVTVIVKGDINGDGKVTPTDLSLYKQMAVKEIDFDYYHKKAVDMNNDYEITETDHSQLKMMLVGLPLPEEKRDPNDKTPELDGEIEIQKSTEGATKQITITVNWPTGTNLDGCTKKISIDGGKTYQDYTGPITLDKNAIVTATYFDKNGNEIASKTLRLENIDTEAPNDFEFTTGVTTSTIIITAQTEDRMKDYEGNLVENEYTGISKYQYKLDNGEWQESSLFENLTANTEYTIYVKAIDHAGNEKEAKNNGTKVKTDPILDPTEEGSRILVTYDTTEPTNANVTVTFTKENEEKLKNYDIQYQVNTTTGQWTTGNKYIAIGNSTIYARLVDKYGQASTNYVTANVANIDKLEPLEFTPTVEYNNETNKTKVTANAEDAPADETNIKSGLKSYTYWEIHESGKVEKTAQTETNSQEYEGNLFEKMNTEEDPIIGIVIDVQDKAGNQRRSKEVYLKDVAIPDDELGYNYNEGPGNITIQGAEKSYYNPVIPVGFKALETEGASWGPYLPSGWNNGLVIEDKKGNQFVWVPVPCEKGTSGVDAIDAVILNTREHIDNEYNLKDYFDEIPAGIENEETKTETGKYGYQYRTEIIKQVEEYQGFYIARYEAGKKDGLLAVQEGLETVNMVTYEQAKTLAEEMYQNPYVISGLPTGVHWDLMSEWIEKEYGRTNEDYIGKGNLSWFEYTFTGRYAEGPDFGTAGVRGEYKYGENVTKQRNEEILLTTGIVEDFRMKNMYDVLGNVWEYTSEKVTLTTGISGHNARGADYYWDNNEQVVWKTSYRCNVPDGDARNEGGFRIILFLSEGKANVEGEYNKTTNGGKASYNNPIIPAGYKAIDTEEAKWGDRTLPAVDWNKGLVIEDKNGNQFVWVPVDGKEVKYETWLEVYLTYEEVGASEIPAAWEEKGGTENSSVKEFKGYYVARYETSENENGKVQTKANQEVKTIITYNEAVEKTNNYENGKTSVAGIITGKQWDTALRWIANEKGEEAVTTDSSSWGNYNGTIGTTGRRSAKNIYDLAGNAWEITAETYGEKIIYRGGAATESGTSGPAGYRDAYDKEYADGGTTYRMVLYIENDGYTAKEVVVPEDNPGIATGAKNTINFAINPSGWTNKNVTVKITTTLPYNVAYSITPASTKEQGKWQIGNEITLTENATILAKLMDENGYSKGTTETYQVTTIDKIAPNAFTPKVTVEKSRVRIQCSTTDNASGIKQYHFYADNGAVIHAATAETNVLSSTLSIGKHQIYVVAEDNAGNMTRSGSVTIEIKSVKLIDVAKIGDYVKTKIYDREYYNQMGIGMYYSGSQVSLRGQGHTLQIVGKSTVGFHGVPEFNIKVVGETTVSYYDGNDLITKNLPLRIGKTFGLPNSGDIPYFDNIYQKANYGIYSANVAGGAGTKEDPYTVDFMWWVFRTGDYRDVVYGGRA